MYSCNDTRCRVGCPIRRSTDQRLLAAPRGFSQRATSFIASWCQGIHRMPLSYSISRTSLQGDKPHHAQKPSSGSVVTAQSSGVANTLGWTWRPLRIVAGNIYSAHNRIRFARPSARRLRAHGQIADPNKIVHTPLNPRRRPLGCGSHLTATQPGDRTAIPGQTSDRATGLEQRSLVRGRWSVRRPPSRRQNQDTPSRGTRAQRRTRT